jgi:TPR repeat protein
MLTISLLAICLMLTAEETAQQAEPATATPTRAPALYSSDVSQLKIKADAGDVEAQVKLARAYQDGNGVEQNDTLAAQWYRQAAEHANPAAQNNLGKM